MSSPYDRGIGPNAVMCYFPDLPYYLSYQIGFDTVINPLQEQVDPTVAGQPMHLIYVPMYVPGGFTGNAATIAGMPRRHSFRSDVPQFFHRRPAFYPSTFSDYSHVTPQFDHHDSMIFGGPVILEEQHHHSRTRTFEYTGNGRPVEIMEIDDSVHDIPWCNICHEFHKEPDGVHNEPTQRSPKRMPSQKPQKQPRHSHQQPSTSGMTGQRDTSDASHSKASVGVARVGSQTEKSQASPQKASEGVATVGSQADKSHASSRKASGGVATDESQTDKSRASSRKASEGVAIVRSQTDKSCASSRKASGGVAADGGQTDKPRASSHKASGDVATDGSQTYKSRASSRKASGGVATDRKKRLGKKVKTNFTQEMPEEHQHGSPDDVQEIECTNYTLPEPVSLPVNIQILPPGLDGQDNDDNKAQDNENPNRDPKVDDN